jgi:O-succinylbenzoate synthase
MDQSLLDSLRVVALPTKTNFRGIHHREVALFEGPYGWSEFSPFLEYEHPESSMWLRCAIESATTKPPKYFRKSIKVNGTIPAINSEEEIETVVSSYPGVKTFKVKVGDNVSEDVARLKRVRSLQPNCKLRIDVNGSWGVDDAVRNISTIMESVGPLEYVEQPCATLEELRKLKEIFGYHVLIAGDEVLRKASDPFSIDLEGAVDILMLKVQPIGGIARAHELAKLHNMPVVVSSALESAVGIAYGLKLAASFEELNFDCGLATGSLLASNVAELQIVNGEIEVTDVQPEINGYEVSPDRFEWWKNRVMKCAEYL